MGNERGFNRWLPLGGVGFLILGVIGTIVYGDAPDFADDPQAIAAFYNEESDAVITGNVLYLFAGAFLLLFVAGLRSALERIGEPDLATVAFAGAVAGTALLLAGASIDASAGLRVDEQGSIDPSSASVIWDLSSILFGLGAAIGWALAALSVAAASLRQKRLPAPIGGLAALIGIVLLIPPISYVGMIALGAWAAIVGVYMYMRPPGVPAP